MGRIPTEITDLRHRAILCFYPSSSAQVPSPIPSLIQAANILSFVFFYFLASPCPLPLSQPSSCYECDQFLFIFQYRLNGDILSVASRTLPIYFPFSPCLLFHRHPPGWKPYHAITVIRLTSCCPSSQEVDFPSWLGLFQSDICQSVSRSLAQVFCALKVKLQSGFSLRPVFLFPTQPPRPPPCSPP